MSAEQIKAIEIELERLMRTVDQLWAELGPLKEDINAFGRFREKVKTTCQVVTWVIFSAAAIATLFMWFKA